MRQEQKAELKAWLVAAGLHAVLFVAVALSGLFLIVQPVKEAEPVEVSLMEMAGSAGGSAAGSAPAPAPAAPPMEVELPTANLPQIQESYTKEPQKQQEYRQQHHAPTPAAQAATTGTAQGDNKENSAGQGSGAGTVAGTGSAPQGTGSGTGNAPGNGNSNGGGTAPVSTERVAARCTYRPSPAYPESLRQQGAEGSVRVLILVAEDDSIESVEVVKSSGYPAMDAAAVSAARGCRFQMNGRRGRYTTTYGFHLTDGDDW